MLCFCSSTLWFKYGLVKEDKLVTRVNLAGAVLNFLFAATYYWHTSQRVSPTLKFAMLVFPDIMRRNVVVRITCDFGSCVKNLKIFVFGFSLSCTSSCWWARCLSTRSSCTSSIMLQTEAVPSTA